MQQVITNELFDPVVHVIAQRRADRQRAGFFADCCVLIMSKEKWNAYFDSKGW